MEAGIRVFLLAENRLLREALARVLGKKSDVRLVGALAFAEDVIREIRAAQAQILLLDSVTIQRTGLQFVSEARRGLAGLRVVVVGMDEDERVFLDSVRAGVMGYVFKDASAMDVVQAVRAVARGEAVCPPGLIVSLFHQVERQWEYPSMRLHAHLGLTRRQQQLLPLIGRGLTNKEIASHLNLSEQTVKNHIHRMMQKVGVGDRLAIVDVCSSTLIEN